MNSTTTKKSTKPAKHIKPPKIKSPRQPKQQKSYSTNYKSGDFKFRNIKYYLAETFRNIVRNKIMSLTSVATVAACLFIVIFSYAIGSNVNHVLSYLETSVGITVFVDDELDVQQVDQLYHEILDMGNVTAVTFIPPQEALENLAEALGDTHGILMSLEPDTLRRSFTVELADIREQRETVEYIAELFGVHSISEAAGVTDTLITLNNFVFAFSFIVMLILGILAIVIITNTIKLTVNNRRNEIIIMKYVGATDWFIKWPFVIEGIVIGIFGAAIPIAIIWISYDGIMDSLRDSQIIQMFTEMPFRSASEIFPIVAPVVVILGVGIGVLGSISAMRKYLSV
ncbi:MAG: permease-like cell division protein FtsX [Defluviitaleaceae bacterium]|nr:permease-like cell division protein FtsX [Defluviitaleaceae bacterium]